ncbi:ABC transporter substrate-binding protein [Micrococcales bacterium 31B]|nr:ABC transporter substrate-binding protein [Micrococcales bacterium 31B]
MKIRPALALAALLTLTLAGCGSSSAGTSQAADGTTTLKVGQIGLTSDAALKVGIDKGYFKDEKLNIEITKVANPPAGIAAAQSGQLSLTYAPSIPMLNAMSQGVPLQVVAAADGYLPTAEQSKDAATVDDSGVFVKPGSAITSPKDLAGKTISVPARKAQLEITIADAIKQDGGDPSTVKWMVLDFESALQALGDGRIDAAGVVSPFTVKSLEAGNELITSPGVGFFTEGAVGLYVTGKSTAGSNAEALRGFQRAITKANAYCNEHLSECQQVASEQTKVSIDVIQAGTPTFWPTTVELADLQRTDDKLVELGYLPKPVDLSGALFK